MEPNRRALGIVFLVGGATFLLARDGGTFAPDVYAATAVVVWWAVAVLAVAAPPVVAPTRLAAACAACLAGLAAWTLASTGWAASAEGAYLEAARTFLYLGVLVLVLLLARREDAAAFVDGIALGLVAVVVLALASRLFPGLLPAGSAPAALRTRLGYPVGYWNGLGALAGMAAPLVLASSQRAARPAARSALVGTLPLLGAAVYLASSRGGAAAGLLGVAALLALAPRHWPLAASVAAGAAGALAGVALLSGRAAVVAGAAGHGARSEGRSAAILLVLVCAVTALVRLAGERAVGRRRMPARVGPAVLGVLAAAIAVAVVAAHPVRRLHHFEAPPPGGSVTSSAFVQQHLQSLSGSGRWQFWTAAVDEFRSRPLEGRGAGSFAAWWAGHGSLALPIQDAHSLYLETLAELGLVGFALLAAFVAAALLLLAAARRAAGTHERDALVVAGLAGAFAAYLLAAGIDWMWELPAVTAVGIGVVAAAAPLARRDGAASRRGRPLRAVVALAALCVVAGEGNLLLTRVNLGRSERAARAGDVSSALAAARRAARLEPWAASPFLQLALVDEQAASLAAARGAIADAERRDPESWQIELVAARLAAEAGDVAAARRSYDRARGLDPRSPLFAPGR